MIDWLTEASLEAAGLRQRRPGAEGVARVDGARVAQQARADGARGGDDPDAPPRSPDCRILNAVALRTTNAAAEAMNARIQRIKRMACGCRNRGRFQNAILFHLGGLDLYPKSVLAHTKFLKRREFVVGFDRLS